MKTVIYSHRNGSAVIGAEVIDSLRCIIENTPAVFGKNVVSKIKIDVLTGVQYDGWSGELFLDKQSKISITSYKNGVGLCIQTGNVARVYADLMKLQALYLNNKISSGVIVVPTRNAALKLASNMASYERLVRELKIFSQVITMPIIIIGFEEG